MSGLTAKVNIVSNALILLGDTPISSLTEERTGAVLGANLFENTYLAILTQHRWRFASKTFNLNKLATAPSTGYNNAYQLPTDLLYLYKTNTSDYQLYGKELHTNAEAVEIEYTYRVDEDLLPAYFVKALEYNLASQFALPLTGDIDKGNYYQRMFKDEIKKAKFVDSTQHPQQEIDHNPYVEVRY